jgi:gluconate 2-dehydrogenase gamma chain
MNRRRFLTGAAVASLAGPACRRQPASAYRTLSDAEAASLGVLCEQIIPTDQDLGARWAGAVRFIDIQLTRHYSIYRERYRGGIAEAEAIASAKFGRSLTALNGTEQLQCAQQLEREDREFFNLLVAHTMQSYYGSPRHGGNRDYVGWRMLGVSPLPVRGRNSYDLARVRT